MRTIKNILWYTIREDLPKEIEVPDTLIDLEDIATYLHNKYKDTILYFQLMERKQ